MEMSDFENSLQKINKRIFLLFVVIAIIGYGLDTYKFYNASRTLFYNNGTCTSITLLAFLLFLLKKINLKQSLVIVFYTAIANIFVGCFLDPFSIFRINFFLRDSLFVVFIITLSSLTIGKKHSLIISGIYFISTIIFTLITKYSFLQSSILLIIIFILGYTVLIYHIASRLEKAFLKLQKNNLEIQEKNEIVKKSNELLMLRQKEIENQSIELTIQRDKLREANASKDKLFSIIAHDLKSPFNSMIGFSDLLLSDIKAYPIEVIEEQIRHISNSAKNTYNLIENLLHWSRSQRGMIQFKPLETNVSEIINRQLKILGRQALLKQIDINFSIEGKDEPAVIDPILFEIIIRNLVTNAIKYSYNNSQIDIKLHYDQKQFTFTVRDYGIGISNEIKECLFTLKEKTLPGTGGEDGTGLGLILCKEFVEMHKGTIDFYSEESKGSRFIVVIPNSVIKN